MRTGPMRSSILAVTLTLLACAALGEMTPLETVKERRYVIRSATATLYSGSDMIYRSEAGAGVWEWNIEKGTWSRLFPLIYGELGGGDGAAIAATEDRIVIQGATFLEFDPVTYRLLRRYPALAPGQNRWGFRGPLVTDGLAEQLGIPAGYYGHPYCPPSFGVAGPICAMSIFPGYPSATFRDTYWNILHRRGFAPRAVEIAHAETFSDAGRWLALDPERSRFWFRSSHAGAVVGSNVLQLGYLPISNGFIGDEVIVESEEQAPPSQNLQHRYVREFFYDPISDSLVTHWVRSSRSVPFVTTRPADLSRPDEVIETGEKRLPLALTTLAPGLPETWVQVVPAIARAAGAYGTFWQSDVWIFNPSDEPVTFSIRRVSRPGSTIQRVLAGNASLELADALGMLGGGAAGSGGDGVVTDALVIESPYRWGEQLAVHSRTYTSDGEGGGTYGQSIPAVPTRDGYSTHLDHAQNSGPVASSTSEFYLDLRYPGMFRHNLGVVNDSAEPLEVDLFYSYSRPFPDREPARTITVAPHSVANVNLEGLLGGEMVLTRPSMMVIAASRPAPVWLSMVDNRTGDATFLPFATFSIDGAFESSMVIPQVANTPGAHNSYWRTDLYGVFLAPAAIYPATQSPTAFFHPSDPAQCGGGSEARETILYGPDGQPGQPQNYPFPALSRRVFPDVVKQFQECTEASITGALELNIGSWMSGFARTYTMRADGGTYGDMLPFYPAGGWPVQHFSGVKIDAQVRTNLGLHNGLDYPVVHRLLVYDRAGNEVRRHELTLEPRRSLQAPIGAIVGDLPPGLYGLTVLPLDAEGRPGRSWAYVSIVDNITGDPTNLW